MIKSWGDVFDVSAQNYILDFQLWGCFFFFFIYSCIFRCRHISLPVCMSFPYTLHARWCVCTYKHAPPLLQTQSQVIKVVSHAAPSQFLFEVTSNKRRCPSVPHALLSTPHHHRCRRCYDCLSPCQMPVGGGLAFTHCWAQGHRNPTACKTPWLCSVCVCEWVGVWVEAESGSFESKEWE